jgi:hypothetical protein
MLGLVALRDVTIRCGCFERNVIVGAVFVFTIVDVGSRPLLGTIDGSVDIGIGDVHGLLGVGGLARIGASDPIAPDDPQKGLP